MRNTEVADIFYEIADILEMQGVAFKPQAYRKAAVSIGSLERPLETVEDFESIPGVGKAISKKIREILETGTLDYLEKLRKELPEGVNQLLQLPEVGPKTAYLLAEQNITSIEELRKALEQHTLQGIKGFGPKTEEKLKKAIKLYALKK